MREKFRDLMDAATRLLELEEDGVFAVLTHHYNGWAVTYTKHFTLDEKTVREAGRCVVLDDGENVTEFSDRLS